MKKQHSLVERILIILTLAVCLLCALVTVAGAKLIYSVTEDGLKNEVHAAARTLHNMYELNYTTVGSDGGFVNKATNQQMTADDFQKITSYIGCSSNIDFTLFKNDTRIFTSVKNSDGSLAVGTKADSAVIDNVINNGKEYFYSKVLVNGKYYVGYYIPVDVIDGVASGMCFAGMPLDLASANARAGIKIFVMLSLIMLVTTLVLSMLYLRRIVTGLDDIKQYITKVANGEFTARMKRDTVGRTDEIGDIGRHAEKLCENLRDMVERDPLTLLYNRRSCMKKLEKLKREESRYSVSIGDIDFFKKINDDYGHAAGDAVLKMVSALLDKYASENGGWASRWGGEEFLCVFPDKNISEVRKILDEIMEEVRSLVCNYEDKEIKLTMTFGAVSASDKETIDATINRADKLLYKGKETGRNRIII